MVLNLIKFYFIVLSSRNKLLRQFGNNYYNKLTLFNEMCLIENYNKYLKIKIMSYVSYLNDTIATIYTVF